MAHLMSLLVASALAAGVVAVCVGNFIRSGEMSEAKPIRVFWSILGQRFYASRAYTVTKNGVVKITGQKFDVTDDIAAAVEKHGITFRKVKAEGR